MAYCEATLQSRVEGMMHGDKFFEENIHTVVVVVVVGLDTTGFCK